MKRINSIKNALVYHCKNREATLIDSASVRGAVANIFMKITSVPGKRDIVTLDWYHFETFPPPGRNNCWEDIDLPFWYIFCLKCIFQGRYSLESLNQKEGSTPNIRSAETSTTLVAHWQIRIHTSVTDDIKEHSIRAHEIRSRKKERRTSRLNVSRTEDCLFVLPFSLFRIDSDRWVQNPGLRMFAPSSDKRLHDRCAQPIIIVTITTTCACLMHQIPTNWSSPVRFLGLFSSVWSPARSCLQC